MKKLLSVVAGILFSISSSACVGQTTAGQSVPGYYANAPQTGCTVGPCFLPYGSVLPVSGTFSASLAGFNPTAGATANLTAGVTTGSVNLPAGADIVVTNSGANTIHFRLTAGASSAVTTDQTLVAGAAAGFHITTATVFSAITDTSTSTVNIQGGAGLVAGYGGGSSGGGGGGGAVTVADGADVTQGAKADAKSTATDTTPITTMQVLKQISASVQAPPSQAVTNTGTFATQAAQSGTWNVTNVSGTVSLPTGAATSALQPTNAAQGSTTSGQTGNLIEGAVTTSPPTYTTAQTSPLSLDTAGNLRVNVIAGGGTGGTSVAQGSTTSGQNVSPMGCRTLTSAPTDTTAQTNMPSCDVNGALRVNVTTATGVAQASASSGQSISPIGVRTLAAAPTDTTAQTNMPVADINGSLRTANTATTWGGVTKFTLTAAASTNATNIKASAGSLYHIGVYNNSATLAWVSFYNTAGTPTCGTSIVYQTMIPANSTSGAGAVEDFAVPLDFSTGIGICVATGIAGTGSVAATSYVVNLGFK